MVENPSLVVLNRESDPTRKNVCFFNNLGDIISKCPVSEKSIFLNS